MHLLKFTFAKFNENLCSLWQHILKLEQYKEDKHFPCARLTCKSMKCPIVKKKTLLEYLNLREKDFGILNFVMIYL